MVWEPFLSLKPEVAIIRILIPFSYFPPALRAKAFPDLALSVFNESDVGGGGRRPVPRLDELFAALAAGGEALQHGAESRPSHGQVLSLQDCTYVTLVPSLMDEPQNGAGPSGPCRAARIFFAS